jgi:hypothetical protein
MKKIVLTTFLFLVKILSSQSRLYIDSDTTISIKYPNNWIYRDDVKIKQIYIVMFFEPKTETGFSIRKTKNVRESTEKKELRLGMEKFTNQKKVNSEDILISGIRTKLISTESKNPISKKLVITRQTEVTINNEVYTLTFSCLKEKIEDYSDKINTFYSSFKIH